MFNCGHYVGWNETFPRTYSISRKFQVKQKFNLEETSTIHEEQNPKLSYTHQNWEYFGFTLHYKLFAKYTYTLFQTHTEQRNKTLKL